uniref:Uncharacterized protein n=1 Tax=Rhizophora mucronata TaxID=61149 RepID=A0A2P2KFD0_RHIMU
MPFDVWIVLCYVNFYFHLFSIESQYVYTFLSPSFLFIDFNLSIISYISVFYFSQFNVAGPLGLKLLLNKGTQVPCHFEEIFC